MREISQRGIELVEHEEGRRKRSYLDQVGLPTIGIGHKLRRSELSSGTIMIGVQKIEWQYGLVTEQIDELLQQDLQHARRAVEDSVTVDLEQHQFDALVSMVFNIGGGAFKRSTLLKKLNAGRHVEVPDQMRRWVYGGGARLDVLTSRREREIAVWRGE